MIFTSVNWFHEILFNYGSSQLYYDFTKVLRLWLNLSLSVTKSREMTQKTVASDPWTYQCGKCGKDFKTKSERDQHMIGCGNRPKSKCNSGTSSPIWWWQKRCIWRWLRCCKRLTFSFRRNFCLSQTLNSDLWIRDMISG